MNITPETYKLIKEYLDRNDIIKLCQHYDISRLRYGRVMSGRSPHYTLILHALRIATKRKKEYEKTLKLLQ